MGIYKKINAAAEALLGGYHLDESSASGGASGSGSENESDDMSGSDSDDVAVGKKQQPQKRKAKQQPEKATAAKARKGKGERKGSKPVQQQGAVESSSSSQEEEADCDAEEEEESREEEYSDEGEQVDAKRKRAPADEGEPKKKKRWRDQVGKGLYVNQLPYEATEEQIAEHFQSCCEDGDDPVVVRVLKDRKTSRFTGRAFVDMPSKEAADKALLLHQGTFKSAGNSRPINVRPALSKADLKERGPKTTETSEEVEKLLDDAVAAGKLEAADIDVRARSYLNTVPVQVAQEAIQDFCEVDKSELKNRSSFFMGLLKRRVAGANTPGGRGKGRGTRGRGGGRGRTGGVRGGRGGRGGGGEGRAESSRGRGAGRGARRGRGGRGRGKRGG
ncbi:unnamed protein product [Chrysoparadoxa australica]